MFADRDTVKKAKRDAAGAYARLAEYREWRSKRSAEDLRRYDTLVEQRLALPMRDWEKKSELEKEIKALFDEITTEKPSRSQWEADGKVWHPDLFKVTLYPSYWKYQSWWVNDLSNGGTAVKIALRLKRDGYR